MRDPGDGLYRELVDDLETPAQGGIKSVARSVIAWLPGWLPQRFTPATAMVAVFDADPVSPDATPLRREVGAPAEP